MLETGLSSHQEQGWPVGRLRVNCEHLLPKGKAGLGTIHRTRLTAGLSPTGCPEALTPHIQYFILLVPGSPWRKRKVPMRSPLSAKPHLRSGTACLAQAHCNPRLCRRLLWSQAQNRSHQRTMVQTHPNTSKTQTGSESRATGLQGAIAVQHR